jgi:hypothetical protein
VIFRNLADNFHPESFANIVSHADWSSRTRKVHQNVPGVLEMQSSNSSDAVLMNIFCHPSIRVMRHVVAFVNFRLAARGARSPGSP